MNPLTEQFRAMVKYPAKQVQIAYKVFLPAQLPYCSCPQPVLNPHQMLTIKQAVAVSLLFVSFIVDHKASALIKNIKNMLILL